MDNSTLQDLLNDVNSMVSHYDLSDNFRAALVQVVIDEYKACRYLDMPLVSINGKHTISVEDLEQPLPVHSVNLNDLKIPWDFPPEIE